MPARKTTQAASRKLARPSRVAVLAGVLAAASWGVANILGKAALDQLPPLTLVLVQLLAGTIALWLAMAAKCASWACAKQPSEPCGMS